MRFKAPLIEIPVDDPFKFDLLGREVIAQALTEFVKSTNDPMVCCINASWGQGKSTFLSMWRQSLDNSGFKTLLFNAWENDFTDDAFVSLIGEFELGISALGLNANVSQASKHLDKAKKIGASIFKRSLPTAVKIATAGLVDLNDISEEAW